MKILPEPTPDAIQGYMAVRGLRDYSLTSFIGFSWNDLIALCDKTDQALDYVEVSWREVSRARSWWQKLLRIGMTGKQIQKDLKRWRDEVKRCRYNVEYDQKWSFNGRVDIPLWVVSKFDYFIELEYAGRFRERGYRSFSPYRS